MKRSLTVNGIVLVGLLAGAPVFAQQQGPLPPPAGTAAQQPAQLLSPQQLDNIVAPIALYPDPLLSQVLAASTYPLEIIEAQQWVKQAGNLQGQQLIDAAKQQDWDPSVQALVAFPDVLALLTRDIRWTRALGDAFLAQQADVMNAIQNMRSSAQANGRLQSTPQQQVTVAPNPDYQNGGAPQAIEIQPTNPEVIYPPSYDPSYVWGPPVGGYYPDLYYPDYGFGYYPPVYVGSYFGGLGYYGGWGWGFNWFGRGLYTNSLFFNHYGFGGYRGFGGGRNIWAHDPGHRWGIPYPNRSVSGRFNNGGYAARNGVSGYRGNANGFNRGSNNSQGFRSFSNGNGQSRPQEGFRSFSNQTPRSNNGQNSRGFSGAAPQQRNFQQQYRAPQQQYRSAPQQQFRSAPSAPRFSGGGGGGGNRGFSGGGGGGGPRGGGGGGGHAGGGGGGGGHRR